jgi:hypothetical protein
MERVMGIEPTLSAWEAEVLPLNYTRPDCSDILVRTAVVAYNKRQRCGWEATLPPGPYSGTARILLQFIALTKLTVKNW